VLIFSNGSIGRLGSVDKDLRLSGSPQGFPARVPRKGIVLCPGDEVCADCPAYGRDIGDHKICDLIPRCGGARRGYTGWEPFPLLLSIF
jgi:hypothetical protein